MKWREPIRDLSLKSVRRFPGTAVLDSLARHKLLLAALIIVVLGLIVYWPILKFSFFWEDPFDIGQVDQHTYTDLFFTPTNNLYYRPLHLVLVKALKLGHEYISPQPLYVQNLVARILGSLLLLGFVRRLTGKELFAIAAALVLLLAPTPYDSTAKAMSAHQVLLPPYLAALWLFLEARLTNRGILHGASFAVLVIALLIHESAVLLPVIMLTLECYLLSRKRVSHFKPLTLIYFIPVALYAGVWLSIPKESTLFSIEHGVEKALYLSQSLSFPVARLLRGFDGLALAPKSQALLAFALTMALLAIIHWRALLPEFALFVAWWFMMSALLWLTLSDDYLETGSRLLYMPTVPAALVWAGLLSTPARIRSRIGALLVALILIQGLVTINSLNSLYTAGSGLMDQKVEAGQRHEKILYVNVPDRFEYRRPLYPLGFWGMMLAPVSQQLEDFVALSTDNEIETRSLSNFPLADDMRLLSPYRVNSRGVDAYGSALLFDTVLWAEVTYLTSYSPDGDIELRLAGNMDVLNGQEQTGKTVASFEGGLELVSIGATLRHDSVQLETVLRVGQQPAGGTTIFVHLVDQSGQIVAQADGDSLGGMIPSVAWREGSLITDVRTVPLLMTPDSGLLWLHYGFYNRLDGSRLPVENKSDLVVQDNAAVFKLAQLMR